MAFHKIINDPIYGFITIPSSFFVQLIDHPFFQRLRRIKQGGFSYLVYPGAMHTRFHHALGSFHITMQAIHTLRMKSVRVSDEEAEALLSAILLHDIGHGPYSHTLEGQFMQVDHESVTRIFMQMLNGEFYGRLERAIEIFRDTYETPFFYQMISGQLDLDRMDYLTRDSFYTGVAEGVIGYDRIIKMLNVSHGHLVVEEKGIYSIEKFLMARRLMYWQVYYHKAVISAEQMLLAFVRRLRAAVRDGMPLLMRDHLRFFLLEYPDHIALENDRDEIMRRFASLDDSDVLMALKESEHCPDPVLSFLAGGLLHRRLFRVEFSDRPFEDGYREEVCGQVSEAYGFGREMATSLLFGGRVRNVQYTEEEEIYILTKKKEVTPFSEMTDNPYSTRAVEKFFLCYPKTGEGKI